MTALKESSKPSGIENKHWREIRRKPSIIVFEGSLSSIDVLMQSLLSTPEQIVVRPRAEKDPRIIIANTFNAGERIVGMLHDKVVGQEQGKRRMTPEYQTPIPVFKIKLFIEIDDIVELMRQGQDLSLIVERLEAGKEGVKIPYADYRNLGKINTFCPTDE
ncbi:MAG: hypothetical protein K2X53_02450 [Alphaproteobacteria bacterium]|nr:hypothetical protein [Alphaproteobacteria bacterium]